MTDLRAAPNGLPAGCTAFPLDGVCTTTDPCPAHRCTTTTDGRTPAGCYCDPERTPPTTEGTPHDEHLR